MAIPYSSNYDETLAFSDLCGQLSLLTNVEQNITVPGDPAKAQAYVVEFSYADDVQIYIGKNTTAALPASGTASTTPFVECRPKKRYVLAGDVLSFIVSNTEAYVGYSFRTIA